MVAASLGVSASRISQLLSDETFRSKVEALRYAKATRGINKDNAYDTAEEQLLEKLNHLIPMMFKPREVLHALQVINQAKRSTVVAPVEQKSGEIVSLTLPTAIIQHFKQEITLNVNNQVIKAGDQDLVTIQSAMMNKLAGYSEAQLNVSTPISEQKRISYEQPQNSPETSSSP